MTTFAFDCKKEEHLESLISAIRSLCEGKEVIFSKRGGGTAYAPSKKLTGRSFHLTCTKPDSCKFNDLKEEGCSVEECWTCKHMKKVYSDGSADPDKSNKPRKITLTDDELEHGDLMLEEERNYNAFLEEGDDY